MIISLSAFGFDMMRLSYPCEFSPSNMDTNHGDWAYRDVGYRTGKNKAHSGSVIRISPLSLWKRFRVGHQTWLSAYLLIVNWSLWMENCFLQCFWEDGPAIRSTLQIDTQRFLIFGCSVRVRLSEECFRDVQQAFFSFHSSVMIWSLEAASKNPLSLFSVHVPVSIFVPE